MKSKYTIFTSIICLLLLISCTKETLEEPTGTCTFNEVTAGDAHPYADLFQAVLNEYIESGAPGVSVAIDMPEFGWWVGCAGMARIEDQTAMEPCHLFNSASVAKPYTATMVMKLVENGDLGLEDPIRNYLPEEMVSKIANADVATIRQLLSHTSGIEDWTYAGHERIDIINDPRAEMTQESRFEKYLYGRPAFGPAGECFMYSNAGMDLLGMIIEEVSGESIKDFFQREIVEALGLTNTYHISSIDDIGIDNMVNGYIEHYPGELQNWTDIDHVLSKTGSGHVGVVATPYDFGRFYQELIRGNVLDSATLDKMLTVEWEVREGVNMCLGLYYVVDEENRAFYVHNGAMYGIQAQTRYFPDYDITMSIQVNIGWIFNESDNQERFDFLREGLLDVIFSE